MRRLICAALLCAPTALHAQSDLQADLAATFAPAAQVESLTDTLSCTALFRSLSQVFGPESDFYAGFRSREGFMASVSGVLWADSEERAGRSRDDVFAVLLPMINGATDQYLAHMDAVTLATDVPFDDQVLDQVEFCNAIVAAFEVDPP